MKVYDNIENYDPFPGHDLTDEECSHLISELKRVIGELIPLRSSKRQTRQYCEKYLRIDRRRDEFENPMKYGKPDTDFPFPFIPQPGEVDIAENIFRPALISVIEDDKYTFGHLWNISHYYQYEDVDIVEYDYPVISDSLVRYALRFDFDTIKERAEKIADWNARIEYIEGELAESRVSCMLEKEDYDSFQVGNEERLHTFLEATIKLSNYNNKKATAENAEKKKRTGSDASEESQPSENQVSDEYYNPNLIDGSDFETYGIVDPLFRSVTQWSNSLKLIKYLKEQYQRSFIDPSEGIFNMKAMNECQELFSKLVNDYSERLDVLYGGDKYSIVDNLKGMKASLLDCINRAYREVPHIRYCTDNGSDTGYPTFDEQPTTPFHNFLVCRATNSCETYILKYVARPADEVSNILLYNFWGDSLEEFQARNTGRLGMTVEDRAKVYNDANIKYFCDKIMSYSEDLIFDCESKNLFSYQSRHWPLVHDALSKVFRDSFADYQRRIANVTSDIDRIYDAGLFWVRQTIARLAYRNDEEADNRKNCPHFSFFANEALYAFFYECCAPLLDEMESDFINDFKEVRVRSIPVKTSPKSDVKVDAEKPDTGKKHSKTIDHSGLYSEWNGKAFTGITIDEFTEALDNADFKLMLQKATDAGTRSGYIGGVKYIMRTLRDYLGQQWYKQACYSIDEDENSVNKVNDGTAAIKRINIKIIKEYII